MQIQPTLTWGEEKPRRLQSPACPDTTDSESLSRQSHLLSYFCTVERQGGLHLACAVLGCGSWVWWAWCTAWGRSRWCWSCLRSVIALHSTTPSVCCVYTGVWRVLELHILQWRQLQGPGGYGGRCIFLQILIDLCHWQGLWRDTTLFFYGFIFILKFNHV